MYRKDLMEKAGLKMPEKPTWDFISEAADKMTDKRRRRLRHLPARQGRLGREHGLPDRHVQFLRRALVRREVEAAVQHAGMEEDARLLCRPDEGRRPSRRLARTASTRTWRCSTHGKCGMWIDATVAASFVTDPKESKVADKVGFALAPNNGLGKSANWLWAWSLAIPAGTKKAEAAEKFIAWATSKDYTELVAVEGRLGQRSAGHAHLALRERRLPEGRAVRQDDAGLDQRGRSEQSDREAGALCRRAVRRDPRVPGHRHRRSASTSRPRSPAR